MNHGTEGKAVGPLPLSERCFEYDDNNGDFIPMDVVFFENYSKAGSPQVQERYFDDLIISTQQIGCDGAADADEDGNH